MYLCFAWLFGLSDIFVLCLFVIPISKSLTKLCRLQASVACYFPIPGRESREHEEPHSHTPAAGSAASAAGDVRHTARVHCET